MSQIAQSVRKISVVAAVDMDDVPSWPVAEVHYKAQFTTMLLC